MKTIWGMLVLVVVLGFSAEGWSQSVGSGTMHRVGGIGPGKGIAAYHDRETNSLVFRERDGSRTRVALPEGATSASCRTGSCRAFVPHQGFVDVDTSHRTAIPAGSVERAGMAPENHPVQMAPENMPAGGMPPEN